jgi:hypothetical protein
MSFYAHGEIALGKEIWAALRTSSHQLDIRLGDYRSLVATCTIKGEEVAAGLRRSKPLRIKLSAVIAVIAVMWVMARSALSSCQIHHASRSPKFEVLKWLFSRRSRRSGDAVVRSISLDLPSPEFFLARKVAPLAPFDLGDLVSNLGKCTCKPSERPTRFARIGTRCA